MEIDVDPLQVIDHLEQVPFLGSAEARRGPLALYGDIFYANLGLEADGVRSRRAHPLIHRYAQRAARPRLRGGRRRGGRGV